MLVSYEQYQEKLKKIENEIDNLLQINAPTVAQSLWVLDKQSLKLIVKGFLLQRETVFAQITDDKGRVIASQGEAGDSDVIRKTIDLYHNQAGSKIFLGKLTLVATKKLAMKDVKSASILIIAHSMILILIIVLYVLYMFRKLVSKHLIKIQQHTSQLVIGNNHPPLKLDRANHRNNDCDELDQLVDSINSMFREANNHYHKVVYQARHDELTGFYNRSAIASQVDTLIHCNSAGEYHALILIDLDHFKLINDSQGHHIGDLILKKISLRLTRLTNNKCIIARSGGDEFILILIGLSTDLEQARKNAGQFTRNLLAIIQKPLQIDDSVYHLTAGAGIDIFRQDIDFKTILKHADNALYHAKTRGVNRLAFFYSNMQSSSDKRLAMENILRKEIDDNRLIVHFQPKYTINGDIYSAEALVRIKCRDGLDLSPTDFIPIAEETGMIIQLGQQVIEKVFGFISDHKAIIDQSCLNSMAINISPLQFDDGNFCNQLVSLARKYAIPDNFIVLEITEETVASDIDHVIDTMLSIKHSGFKLSIDDFGTGHSSLRYLQHFPLDELKIDRSFVGDITRSTQARAITKTIVDMAHHLGFDVVAEGVENSEQFDLLGKFGCNFFQGYFFSKPLSEEDFIKRIRPRENPSANA